MFQKRWRNISLIMDSIDLERMKKRLKGMLSLGRWRHSLSASKVASQLAIHYGLDGMRATIAALLHDCAKALTKDEQMEYIERNGVYLDEVERKEEGLWHGPIGEVMARKEFGIDDEEILRAIRIHSIGASDMSNIMKVVYIADYIEPYRHFRGRREIAHLAFRDLDLATLYVLNHKLTYILHKRIIIHPDSIEARNLFLERILRGKG